MPTIVTAEETGGRHVRQTHPGYLDRSCKGHRWAKSKNVYKNTVADVGYTSLTVVKRFYLTQRLVILSRQPILRYD
jgi:hypothetical protein